MVKIYNKRKKIVFYFYIFELIFQTKNKINKIFMIKNIHLTYKFG